MGQIMSDIPSLWRKRTLLSTLLLPASWLFLTLAKARRARQAGRNALPVPVIVVGNISVGGNGKTPVVVALAKALQAQGEQVGIVSRGYGRRATRKMLFVEKDSNPNLVGDEPLLIAQKTGLPVVVGRERFQAAQLLLHKYPNLSYIISDDGMQHYHLPRQIELAVIAADFMLGNGRLIPAGPLREPPTRLNEVDAILYTGTPKKRLAVPVPQFVLNMESAGFYALETPERTLAIQELPSDKAYFAFTAIARPERFFKRLQAMGMTLQAEKAFPDHAQVTAEEMAFAQTGYLLMTEKDSVKTHFWPRELRARCFVLRYDTTLPQELLQLLLAKEST